MNAVGLDLSHHDGYFKPELATAQIDFAIQKLTEGLSFVDPKIDEIWQGVKQIQIRGAYHYLRSGLSWLAQTDHYLEHVIKYEFHFHAVDVEELFNVYSESFFADARRMVDYIAYNTKQPCFLYTNCSTFDQMYVAIYNQYGAAGLSWIQTVPFWIANPGTAGAPGMPVHRSTWDIHQFMWAGSGTEYGVGAAVDVNVFHGDANAMRTYLHLGEVITPPPIVTPGETMTQVIRGTAKGTVTRRDAPAGNGFSPARYLMLGDTIEADKRDTVLPQWLHITKINGVAIASEEWASAGTSQQYIAWSWVDVPPVDPPVTPPATKTPFTLTLAGYKPFTGELEKE